LLIGETLLLLRTLFRGSGVGARQIAQATPDERRDERREDLLPERWLVRRRGRWERLLFSAARLRGGLRVATRHPLPREIRPDLPGVRQRVDARVGRLRGELIGVRRRLLRGLMHIAERLLEQLSALGVVGARERA